MNLPKGKGPFPVIITNHGYIPPRIYTIGRGLKREQDYLAKRGYIVIHPDYRNHALSDKDPDELARFRLGHSRGGGIALNIIVTKPDLVQAVVLYAPTSMVVYDNFERWTLGKGRRPRTVSTARRKERRQLAQKISSLYGSPESNLEFWDKLSAKTYLKNIKAPILIVHGTADKSVPIEWSDKLAKALSQEGKSLVYEKYPGGKHEFIKHWPAVMKRVVKFFDAYLKKKS